MNLSLKQKVIIVIIYTAACVAVGRYLGPSKVVIQKEVTKSDSSIAVKDDKKKVDTNRDVHSEKTTVEKDLPDGTKEITTKVVEDNKTKRTVQSDDKLKDTDLKTESDKSSKTVERTGGKVNLSLLAGYSLSNPAAGLSYGGIATTPLLGPITVGPFLLANPTTGFMLGIGAGLSF